MKLKLQDHEFTQLCQSLNNALYIRVKYNDGSIGTIHMGSDVLESFLKQKDFEVPIEVENRSSIEVLVKDGSEEKVLCNLISLSDEQKQLQQHIF